MGKCFRMSGRQPRILWARAALLLLLACLSLCRGLPADTQAAPAAVSREGSAEIGVMADVTNPKAIDTISIRIINSTDRLRLRHLADLLGQKVGYKPRILGYKRGDPSIITDKGIGLDIQLPIMRADGYLPVGPFVEVFAPVIKHLQIVYLIRGAFPYQGFEKYQNTEVAYTVSPPSLSSADSPVPWAVYRADVTIKKPAITISIPRGPHDPLDSATRWPPNWLRGVLIVLALALIGAAVGYAIITFLPRRLEKSRPDAKNKSTHSGG